MSVEWKPFPKHRLHEFHAAEGQDSPILHCVWSKHCVIEGQRTMSTLSVLQTYFQLRIVFLRRVGRLLVAACVVPSSPILTLMKEALSLPEMSVLTKATRRNIPEDAILHSHRRENLKSYIALTGWTL
jgi:hypothetical protein